MSNAAVEGRTGQIRRISSGGWRELFQKEDWWAVWIGLGLVTVGYLLFERGGSLKWLVVTPPKWTTAQQLMNHFAHSLGRYVALFVLWASIFGISLRALGHRLRDFLPSFAFLFVLSLAIFTIGQWAQASRYNLEPPLVALLVGLLISNLGLLPRSLDVGFRVEFYIKTGIVLLGATLPFTLIVWAGPVAIVQASIVALATFAVIFFVGRRLGLDPRFAATLGAGGSVCGVSAAIAVSSAVGARKEETSISIATVILWAIVMIFVLPLAARYLKLPAGIAGAWIGTSEFADAAGLAAAQTYGGYAGAVPGISGTSEQALSAFTLMKVVGRDAWIGIWAFVLALIASTRWGQGEGAAKPRALQIWERFPKFVLGFLAASLLVTAVTGGYTLAEYNKEVTPALVAPLKDLRTWAFIFCFLSIGLTTRVRELARGGIKPVFAFSAGVLVNVLLGFVFSTWIFASHWRDL
jgi:uncharacterized integral membrane protein (TIGR00698 family)